MTYDNEVSISMIARSQNEAFARIAAAAFTAPLDPLLSDLTDIKTAVSEAVTNAIIHGYENREGYVFITFRSSGNDIYITVTDEGVGIEDLEQAMRPLYTSKPELERSGMGFTVMQTFMDHVDVTTAPGRGTTVEMRKTILRQGYKSDLGCMFSGIGNAVER